MGRARHKGTRKKRRGTAGWKALAWKKDPHCHYCGTRIRSAQEGSTDHKKPLSDGGYSKRSNYLLSCHPCNNRKGSMDYDTFMALIAREKAA